MASIAAHDTINLFHVTGLFLYPIKTSEKLWVSDIFSEYVKEPVAQNWLNKTKEQPNNITKQQ